MEWKGASERGRKVLGREEENDPRMGSLPPLFYGEGEIELNEKDETERQREEGR